MKGNSIANLYGKLFPGKKVVIYASKGRLFARHLPRKIHMLLTELRHKKMRAFAKLSSTASEFYEEMRSRWGGAVDYAASRKEKELMTHWQWYFKFRTRFHTNWFSLFIAKNMIAESCGMSWPRLHPPFVRDYPPAPMIRWAKYDEKRDVIYGEFEVLPLSGGQPEVFVRIWLAGYYVFKIHPTVHIVKSIGPAPTPKDKMIVVPFEIDHIRCAGVTFQQENLLFKDMAFGQVFVFADMVWSPREDVAPCESVYSGEAVVTIPRRGKFDHTNPKPGRQARFVLHKGETLSKSATKLLLRLKKEHRKERKQHRVKVEWIKPKWEKKKK